MLIHASLPGQNLKNLTKKKSNQLTIINQLNQSDDISFLQRISVRFISTTGK
jgi:hypothetical protein